MTDLFNVTGAYDKPSYVAGDTIKVTITGDDVQTVTSQGQAGPIDIPVIALAAGAQSTIHMPQEPVTITTVTHLPVVIDTTRPIVDTSPTPRVWAVAANKLSISAVA